MPVFNPVPARVEDILNSPTQFAIPIYQREYKWGKEEALELIEDLESYAPTGKGCYAYVQFPLCIFTEMSVDDAAL